VRGLGEGVQQLQQLSPFHAAVCQWWHAQALTRAGLREPLLYETVKALSDYLTRQEATING
jgi:hypothetical protein